MQDTIEQIITLLKKQNIQEFEIDISKSVGTSTAVRLGKVENISKYQNQNLDITIYNNQQTGHASSVDLSISSIQSTINAAINIAKYTEFDKFHSLAPKEVLAFSPPDLNMFFPWELSAETAVNLAFECEEAGLSANGIDNSNGAEISSFSGTSWYVNSSGLSVSRKSSIHSLGCSLMASNGDDKQTSYEYCSVLDAKTLLSATKIGEKAVKNTLKKLGGSLIKSGNYPVIFTNKVSSSIISSILGSISGSSQYRKSTFLEGAIDKIIMPENINIIEKPLALKTIGSRAFDDDGVLKNTQHFIKDGRVATYIMGQYSANQMQSKTTGNAGGVNNVIVPATQNMGLQEIIKQMQNGIVVDELMGQGVNGITGDYSRGASGFLIKNGEIIQRIAGITIAGNLKQMIQDIEIIGNDFDTQKNIKVGSILIKNMVVAGS